MILVPFDLDHIRKITPQDAQKSADLSGEWISGPAWTAMDGDRIAAVGGFLMQWDGRFLAWAIIAKGANMRKLTRIAKTKIDAFDVRRIEATIDVGFRQAIKWAEMLGFEFEGVLRCAGLNGEDFAMYSKVVR